ncbi:MAG TPA: mercury methylation corrinoid protein HgcA [Bacteroidales bacterium]|nr:mercury methylation corrinoid protein HgcA [Bacteroidales bacterium]HPS17291.1 mercury methylation corrinoid protein HgcA [Bacteroidales bacterium]
MLKDFIIGKLNTSAGSVAQVSTVWSTNDILSTIKVRWSIGRMDYKVKQGLYAVGNPDENSNIFVTANFKLSFDHLRRALQNMNAWILVLDTKGVNVWCAAGKGTFGTKELVYRIKAHELEKIVTHRKIIVPQLGATGVSAHEVKSKTGFNVIYGPVRAEDIKAFVDAGFKATAEMRKVEFPLVERLKLIPVEITYGKYYLIFIPALFFILSGLNVHGYSVDLAWQNGGKAFINLFSAYFAGCALTPILLPWIPFKRFSLKGLIIGWLIGYILMYFQFLGNNILEIISWFLIIGSISSFLAMNFTGSSTFTSLSGVQKEMKLSLPIQIIAASIGLIGWIITRFL